MIKVIYLIPIFLFLFNCSFDDKTGIWSGGDQVLKKTDENDQNLEIIFKKKNNKIKEKKLPPNQILIFEKPKQFSSWSQSYQNKFNNLGNILFLNTGNYKKYSKISNTEINKSILVNKENLFYSDSKGNIGVFSLSRNQLIYKYNFYKKKLKKTKKDIKIILHNDKIIAADNFGYVYSIDHKKNKLDWAKNFLVPIRSNLKIIDNILFLSDEKNKIILINTTNGNKIDEFYTQPSKTVSSFQSNLAIDNYNNLLFLSTNGSLYSLNLINQKKINWIQNFKPENEIIFNGNPINISNDKIIISTNNNISLINKSGGRIWELDIKSNIIPTVSGNIIFTINKNNYLVFIDIETGKIIYSENISGLINRDFKKNFHRKIKKINKIFLADNKLILISNNSYFIQININKTIKIESIKKNPFDISSGIIFLNKEMIFVSKNKKVYKVN